MARRTKKDECLASVRAARLKQDAAQRLGNSEGERLSRMAASAFSNAHECLLSASVADKRNGGGGSNEGWALRSEAAGLLRRGNKLLEQAHEELDEVGP